MCSIAHTRKPHEQFQNCKYKTIMTKWHYIMWSEKGTRGIALISSRYYHNYIYCFSHSSINVKENDSWELFGNHRNFSF